MPALRRQLSDFQNSLPEVQVIRTAKRTFFPCPHCGKVSCEDRVQGDLGEYDFLCRFCGGEGIVPAVELEDRGNRH